MYVQALQRLIDFKSWARSDEHMVKRMKILEEIKERKQELAENRPSQEYWIIKLIAMAAQKYGIGGNGIFSIALQVRAMLHARCAHKHACSRTPVDS